jgi:hypothetical protein
MAWNTSNIPHEYCLTIRFVPSAAVNATADKHTKKINGRWNSEIRYE